MTTNHQPTADEIARTEAQKVILAQAVADRKEAIAKGESCQKPK